jgi:hypothetical protein
MGNRGDVYERYYMPNFVDKDCLAIYLGTTRLATISCEQSAASNATAGPRTT